MIDGVYKTGFASTQAAYEAAVIPLFASLDLLDKLLSRKDYLVGGRLTEADVRLFVTIVRRIFTLRALTPADFPTQLRFDVAYVGRFKCNIRTIRDGYPNIHRWLRQLYWKNPAFKDTCHFDHIKAGYYSIQAPVGVNFYFVRVVPLTPRGQRLNSCESFLWVLCQVSSRCDRILRFLALSRLSLVAWAYIFAHEYCTNLCLAPRLYGKCIA